MPATRAKWQKCGRCFRHLDTHRRVSATCHDVLPRCAGYNSYDPASYEYPLPAPLCQFKFHGDATTFHAYGISCCDVPLSCISLVASYESFRVSLRDPGIIQDLVSEKRHTNLVARSYSFSSSFIIFSLRRAVPLYSAFVVHFGRFFPTYCQSSSFFCVWCMPLKVLYNNYFDELA